MEALRSSGIKCNKKENGALLKVRIYYAYLKENYSLKLI